MNFGSCVKVSILSLVLSTAAYIPAGMANTQSNPAETLERFQNERPDAKYYSVDSENADLTLSAIAGIYARTTNITDIYVEKVNAHSDFAQLVASREVLGEEEYKKAVESLSAEEKAEYDEYLNSNYSILAESIQLIPEVQNLNQGISSLDPKDLASSPLRSS